MVDEEADAAGAELRAVLPAGWIVIGPVRRKDDRGWAIYARQLPGPGQDPDAWREASGRTEASALRAMAQQFRVGPAGPTADSRLLESETALVERLRDEILAGGPITFARFMERALYEPGLGYYAVGDARPGRGGDFLTAPEAHSLFGRTLASQVAECWRRLGGSAPLHAARIRGRVGGPGSPPAGRPA